MKKNLNQRVIALFVAMLSVGLTSCCKDNPEIIPAPDTSRTIRTEGTGMHVSKSIVKNGDTIILTTDVSGTIDGEAVTFTVSYLCDDNEIGTSTDSSNKYQVAYLVKDLSIGEHILKSHVTSHATSDNITYKYSINIIVTD